MQIGEFLPVELKTSLQTMLQNPDAINHKDKFELLLTAKEWFARTCEVSLLDIDSEMYRTDGTSKDPFRAVHRDDSKAANLIVSSHPELPVGTLHLSEVNVCQHSAGSLIESYYSFEERLKRFREYLPPLPDIGIFTKFDEVNKQFVLHDEYYECLRISQAANGQVVWFDGYHAAPPLPAGIVRLGLYTGGN